MLLVPLITGAAAGNPQGVRIICILLFAAIALSLFCLRTPMEAALGISPIRPQNHQERRLVYYSIILYSSVAVLALTALMVWPHAYGLLVPGAIAAIVFLLQAALKRLARRVRLRADIRMVAQLIGAIGLSSTAAGAYYLASGHFGATAAIVWLANWLFAANQIHFVQLRIHSARALTAAGKLDQGKGFLLHQAFSLLSMVLIWRTGWLPGLILVAFAPLWARGIIWFCESPRPLQVRRLGMSELLYAIVFGIFVIAGFHHPLG
jgi:hypothetical protein